MEILLTLVKVSLFFMLLGFIWSIVTNASFYKNYVTEKHEQFMVAAVILFIMYLFYAYPSVDYTGINKYDLPDTVIDNGNMEP